MFLQIKFVNIGAVNWFTVYAKMALLFLITEESTVPCFPTIYLFLGDHFGVNKKKSGNHFGVDLGIISELGIISGAVQV